MKHDARKHLRANLLMLAAAAIWGSAFVAQRLSLAVIGPFLFTGLRFLLGAAVLAPLLGLNGAARAHCAAVARDRARLLPGLALGGLLAVSISLQQIGLQYTKIANAGFISSLYVVLVPIIGVFFRHRTGVGTWLGALLAAIGLYFLSVDEHFSMLYGDWFQLAGAIVIAAHVIAVGHLVRRHDPLVLSFMQFVVCGALCLALGLAIEPIDRSTLVRALPTLLYGGLLSVGVGYTLQVVAQRDAAPAHAAVIFSMEGVFAAIAGWAALGETLSLRALAGCALMLAGLLVCQLLPGHARRADDNDALPA
ncbi:DMT family transporter [Burkholderia thailandensis]|uniref:Membrane protein, putative n=1 Tax=Burkholderia thailandensis (strain ATCC 700388 / DSM 13276 / CCUG 48851 / CIP 106301 / E264) TaxID=271848 RepID=Q2T7R3_BURTA|nr:DMT family transporter [Burkholderia thailandensis]ABC35179.1 membrane protein, putative [Burkholderia thailandensis E264]AHI76788.1 eamA-like transporter family protein [Burkholderia thailandensis 2002721723]AIP27407.1 eamA-like transporter family protein [Burkholderia thailandensis E264]AIT22755.1 eamA-like transporter family protein [Burkholderia thailandensis E254]AJY02214.1 eamA-like transporter family protein [Burkholderia thailandensis 2002721643]